MASAHMLPHPISHIYNLSSQIWLFFAFRAVIVTNDAVVDIALLANFIH